MSRIVDIDSRYLLERSLQSEGLFCNESFVIARSLSAVGKKFMTCGVAHRPTTGRVFVVTRGWLSCIINLLEYRLDARTIAVVLPGTVYEVTDHSEDIDIQFFSYDSVYFDVKQLHLMQRVIRLDETMWQITTHFFDILWLMTKQPAFTQKINSHTQRIFLMQLKRYAESDGEMMGVANNLRTHKLFYHLAELIKCYGTQERNISFYADKLCISPNHLMTLIKDTTGSTIKTWIDLHLIQQAKMKLKYGDSPIAEISEQLNFPNPSFFSNFFKRKTGLTPSQYRNL